MPAVISCTPPASKGTFDSENPASRIYAIHRAGNQRDASAIPKLVESLDHDDPAVRMMAILALERITGQRLGYDPYAPEPDRRLAVDRWAQAVRAQRWSIQTATGEPKPSTLNLPNKPHPAHPAASATAVETQQ
ncbi:MAG: HEAT repeat domain-containing protein [Phycisphaeraceae bacterium]|nr:HEAT repeat domain-containing protein [Phycisphaeraceae bacterium]